MAKIGDIASYADARHKEAAHHSRLVHGLGTSDWNTHDPFRNMAAANQRQSALSLDVVAPLSPSPLPVPPPSTLGSIPSTNGQVRKGPSPGLLREVGQADGGMMKLFQYESISTKRDDSAGPSEAQQGAASVVFIHGFLGTPSDWIPIMHGVSSVANTYAVSLPGHHPSVCSSSSDSRHDSIDFAATCDALLEMLASQGVDRPVLVGYSMGARIALHLVASHPSLFRGVAVLSGTAGISDALEREERTQRDAKLASEIRGDADKFMDAWYSDQELFATFRRSPRFGHFLRHRQCVHVPDGLSRAIAGLSVGRMHPLWDAMRDASKDFPSMLVLAGAEDPKYVAISKRLEEAARGWQSVRRETIQGALGTCCTWSAPKPLYIYYPTL